MKKYLYYFLAATVAVLATSCGKEVAPEINEPAFSIRHIKAYTDSDFTKTALDGIQVDWSVGDAITVFDDNAVAYHSNPLTEGGSTADFTVSMPAGSYIDAAVYPKDADATYDLRGDIYSTFPASQIATKDSFGNGANLAVADGVENVNEFSFKNVGGLLALTVKSDCASDITSIAISANEYMAGPVKIDKTVYSATIDDKREGASKSISLTGSFVNNGTYYFVVLPGTYTGLTIVFTKNNGQTATYTNSNTLTVERNGNTKIGTITIPASKWLPAFQEVTSLSGITNGTYVIVNNGFYLPNGQKTSSAPTAKAAPTITDGIITGTVNAEMKWSFTATGTANQFTIKSGNNYLYEIKDNNGLRVGTTQDKWTIATNGEAFSLKGANNSRYCATYNSQDWRSYTSATASNYGDGGIVHLYKYCEASNSGGSTDGPTSGSVTVDMSKLTNPNTTSSITYGTYNWTDGSISGIYNGASSTTNTSFQFNYSASGSSNYRDRQAVYNTTALPGRITSVVMDVVSGGTNRNWKVYVSATALTPENYTAGMYLGEKQVGSNVSFDVSSGNYYYFYCAYTTGSASYISSVVVNHD